jgi:para-aminobenzoate synthetase component 1
MAGLFCAFLFFYHLMQKTSISLKETKDWKAILFWANQYKYCCYFSGQQVSNYPYGSFPNILAIGDEIIQLMDNNVFDSLDSYLNENDASAIYGFFSYDLFEETHQLKSEKKGAINWPSSLFFKPHTIILFKQNSIEVQSDNLAAVALSLKTFIDQPFTCPENLGYEGRLKPDTSQKEYINTVNKLRKHIEDGDIYEINYCINNYATTKTFDPLVAYYKLNAKSPTPFSTYLKCDKKYVICASPERFIKAESDKIISQPIKGTAKRAESALDDNILKEALYNNEKERAENMMIVDLVRNDLSQSSIAGTVKVEELFGIYSFKYVHQMISTITATRKTDISGVQAIKNAFPMGSMTGAPKKSAIQLIEKYEKCKRGVFSGSIGYFNNQDSFDFNVVIRSLFYDSDINKLNYQIGSAITYDSNAEEEYKECKLKAQAIEEILKA